MSPQCWTKVQATLVCIVQHVLGYPVCSCSEYPGRIHAMTFNSDTYILLDGLVCSIVGYFYESRRILASP